jgi:hypothetical protein
MTKKDKELISFIGKLGVLSVRQLSILSYRSKQSIRRRIRHLLNKKIINVRQRPYGQKKGRPENLIILTNKGYEIFFGEHESSGSNFFQREKFTDPIFIEHELLLNWALIHLIEIERQINRFSIKYLTQNLASLESQPGSKLEIADRIPIQGSNHEYAEFIPDAVFTIQNSVLKKSLLFFLEVDMGTETIASSRRDHNDVRQKIVNYQTYFRTGRYKRFEKILGSRFKGFRLLFLTNSFSRLKALCRLVREMPPSDFVWLTDQDSVFSEGLSSKIWAKGGRQNEPCFSILGEELARNITV